MLSSKVDRSESAPAHMQVRQQLLELIEGGVLKPGDQLPGEQDIAKQAGVSRMTANKAILSLVTAGWLVREKGKGTFVAERPRNHSRIVLSVRSDEGRPEDDYYFGPLYWGLHDSLSEVGMMIEVDRSPVGVTMRPSDSRGIIVISPDQSSMDTLESMATSETWPDAETGGALKVIVIGASWQSKHLSMVDSDNQLGAAMAVNHLVDLGHRDLLFVGAEPSDSNTLDRVKGFRRAMKARGLKVTDDDIVVATEALGLDPAAEAAITQRLSGERVPTAIFAAGAKIAVQVVTVASRLGLRVPHDLSVVGYDDPAFLSFTNPPMTTVAQPLEAMAKFAAQTLLDSLLLGDPQPKTCIFDPELIVRESTAEPRPQLAFRSLT